MEGFIDMIVVWETRKVSYARITSIHFPVLRYFAIFASRCLIGRGNCGNLSIPDIIILLQGLYSDNTFSMGGIIPRRLSMNHTKGPIFGGIYATRLAAHFNIPIRHYEKEEKVLPRVYLDYKSMVAHDFIVKNRAGELKYQLFFNKHHPETITLPAPSLFDLTAGHYFVLPEAVYAYRGQTSAPKPELEPPLDPYRPSSYQWDPEEIANLGHPEDPPQYTGEGYFDHGHRPT